MEVFRIETNMMLSLITRAVVITEKQCFFVTGT